MEVICKAKHISQIPIWIVHNESIGDMNIYIHSWAAIFIYIFKNTII